MHHPPLRMNTGKVAVAVLLAVLLAALIACKSPTPPKSTDPTESAVSATFDPPSETGGDSETNPDTVTAPPETSPLPESATEAPTEVETSEPPSDPETESSPVEEEPPLLPMEGNTFVLGDPDSPSLGTERYLLFAETHRRYLGESFTLYGLYQVLEECPCISFGTGMTLPLLFLHETRLPDEGSFVKLSATYGTPPEEMKIPSAFTCMMVSDAEILREPEVDEVTMYVIAELLFVRFSPDSGDGADPIAALPKGTPVHILEASCGPSGEWCRIAFEGDIGYGYVKALYLAEEPIP